MLTLLSLILEGVLQLATSLLGVIGMRTKSRKILQHFKYISTSFNNICTGNIASIFLLTRKELSSFFNQLLAVLCSFDMVYLLTMMLEAIRNLGLETSVHVIIFSYLLYPLNAIAMMGSIYMTIVIGFERYQNETVYTVQRDGLTFQNFYSKKKIFVQNGFSFSWNSKCRLN